MAESDDAFEALLQRYPWPSKRPLAKQDAFEWSLDGGGRHLMQALFEGRATNLMVEIGSFMGGSALQWLRFNPSMRLVCVDPWPDNLAVYVRNLMDTAWAQQLYDRSTLQEYSNILHKYGTLKVVQNNLWDFRKQIVLVNKRIQDAKDDIQELKPDTVFIDAVKEEEEFIIADSLFPNAQFTGDDWSWKDKNGYTPVPGFAAQIALKRNGAIYADRATFVISEERFGVIFDERYKYNFS